MSTTIAIMITSKTTTTVTKATATGDHDDGDGSMNGQVEGSMARRMAFLGFGWLFGHIRLPHGSMFGDDGYTRREKEHKLMQQDRTFGFGIHVLQEIALPTMAKRRPAGGKRGSRSEICTSKVANTVIKRGM